MALVNPAHTQAAVAKQLRGRRVDTTGAVFRSVLLLSLAVAVAALVILLYDVLSGGVGTITDRGVSDFVQRGYSQNATKAGVYQGLVGTITIAVFVVLLAFPIGAGAAVYLEEYAPKSKLTGFIDIAIRNLAGVPSVVYGILGFSIFVKTLGGITGGSSVLAGGLTLAILVLPIVIITSAEAIRAVPGSIREAGFGVGATRWEVVKSHVLPYALPGILTGTVLALARAMGEAAPLILVGAKLGFFSGGEPGDLTGDFTALPNLIARWSALPLNQWDGNVNAAIIVLLALVLLTNTAAIVLRNRFEKNR